MFDLSITHSSTMTLFSLLALLLFCFPLPSLSLTDSAPYGNSSSIPLYGPGGVPLEKDITPLSSSQGWFEAFSSAIVTTNPEKISACLDDLDDGTVNVTLPFVWAAPWWTIVDKRWYGNASTGVAWPAALFDGLTKAFLDFNTTNTTNFVARGLAAMYGGTVGRNCGVPTDGSPNPYDFASTEPVVAMMQSNATPPTFSNRFIHVMPQSGNGSNNYVTYDGISVPSEGASVQNMQLINWMINCKCLYRPSVV
jgi:hypothetical protein